MERCPCCHARLRERIVCSRCQSDLSLLIDAKQKAQTWLNKAIIYYQKEELANSIHALESSLSLQKTALAITFRDFFIQQQSQVILDLLAQKQQICAKKKLYCLRALFPFSYQLQHLNAFTDYLLVSNNS